MCAVGVAEIWISSLRFWDDAKNAKFLIQKCCIRQGLLRSVLNMLPPRIWDRTLFVLATSCAMYFCGMQIRGYGDLILVKICERMIVIVIMSNLYWT